MVRKYCDHLSQLDSPNRARSDRSSILKRAMRFLKRFYNAIKKHVDSRARLDATPYSASRWPPRIDARFFSEPAYFLWTITDTASGFVATTVWQRKTSQKIRARIASLAYKPLISVIMPVYKRQVSFCARRSIAFALNSTINESFASRTTARTRRRCSSACMSTQARDRHIKVVSQAERPYQQCVAYRPRGCFI